MNNERVRGKALKAGVSSIIIRHFICFSYVSNHVGLFTSVGVENLEKNKHNWKLRANATFQKKKYDSKTCCSDYEWSTLNSLCAVYNE